MIVMMLTLKYVSYDSVRLLMKGMGGISISSVRSLVQEQLLQETGTFF